MAAGQVLRTHMQLPQPGAAVAYASTNRPVDDRRRRAAVGRRELTRRVLPPEPSLSGPMAARDRPQRPEHAVSYATPYSGAWTTVAQPPMSHGLEITDVQRAHLAQGRLQVSVMHRGTAWLDTGTFASLMQAGQFVHVVEERQGRKIAWLEEIPWRQGWIGDEQLLALAEPLGRSAYGAYLSALLGRA